MNDDSLNLKEQEDLLFNAWAEEIHIGHKFIRDGIMADMERPVICFLLKEWPDEQHNDLRKHIYFDGAKKIPHL